MGIDVEMQHHEVGTAGQAEIDIRFDTLLHMADKLMLYKYVVKSVARAAGKTVTFMPKPLFGDNGSGMHCHQSLWKDGEPLFYDEVGYAGLSDMAPLLHRRPARSTRRRCWLSRTRRRTPITGWCQASRRQSTSCTRSGTGRPACAFRSPVRARRPSGSSSASRPVQQPLHRVRGHADGRPRRNQEQDRATGAHRQGPVRAPAGRGLRDPEGARLAGEVLECLEADHEYLLKGGVFTGDLIETWVDYKQTHEIDPIRLRPHPHEFEMYFDI